MFYLPHRLKILITFSHFVQDKASEVREVSSRRVTDATDLKKTINSAASSIIEKIGGYYGTSGQDRKPDSRRCGAELELGRQLVTVTGVSLLLLHWVAPRA